MNTMYIARLIQDGPMMVRPDEDTSWVTSLFRLLMLAIVVAGVIWVAKILVGHSETSATNQREPLDLAKERYAKGEISKEQLDDIRKELRK